LELCNPQESPKRKMAHNNPNGQVLKELESIAKLVKDINPSNYK
jgi:hypothetical protein